jgi:TPR repeat protein
MYENGQGVIQNYIEAVKWYQLAADQGFAGAQIRLGVMYGRGQGVTRDFRKAVKCCKLAVKQGYQNACKALKDFYRAQSFRQLSNT